jgi:hypothetical protein
MFLVLAMLGARRQIDRHRLTPHHAANQVDELLGSLVDEGVDGLGERHGYPLAAPATISSFTWRSTVHTTSAMRSTISSSSSSVLVNAGASRV